MIKYTKDIKAIEVEQLEGFFVGWPNPPSPLRHKEILRKSTYIWLAIDEETNRVVGFITAISDQIMSAYIPLLEVLPSYKGKGIGTKLTTLILEELKDMYMIDLLCDEEVMPFYERLNMFRCKGMCFRNYSRQSAE